MPSLLRKAVAEFIGVAVFVGAIVGVNYNAPVNPLAVPVLAGTLGLMVLLTSDTSGGHLNPAVTLFFAVKRQISWSNALAYFAAQIAGGVLGAFLGGAMHGNYNLQVNTAIIGKGELLSEVIATAGLVWLIGYLASRDRGNIIPFVVAAWIFAAGSFTGSGAAANPAVTIGRMFSFAAPIGVEQGMYFILTQVLGVLVAVVALMFVTPVAKAKKKAKK